MTQPSYQITSAGFADAQAICAVIRSHPNELIARPIGDVVQNIDRFLVARLDGRIVGTVSWAILPEAGQPRNPSVEIKSLAVEAGLRGKGIGRALVQAALDRVRAMKPAQILALTFHPEFFEKLGFRRIPKENLMHKIYMGCINCTRYDSPFTCPEIAVGMDCERSAD